jgi:hypothetical protein
MLQHLVDHSIQKTIQAVGAGGEIKEGDAEKKQVNIALVHEAFPRADESEYQ